MNDEELAKKMAHYDYYHSKTELVASEYIEKNYKKYVGLAGMINRVVIADKKG